MKIETKFNSGNYVYFIKNSKITREKISIINITIYTKNIDVVYTMDDLNNTKIYEQYCFNTKEELINFLLKSII